MLWVNLIFFTVLAHFFVVHMEQQYALVKEIFKFDPIFVITKLLNNNASRVAVPLF